MGAVMFMRHLLPFLLPVCRHAVDARRLIRALALLTVFAGLASAQGSPAQCSTTVGFTPTLSSEGYAQQAGDIALICTGGAPLANGSVIPRIDIQLFYNTAVTSRLLPIPGGGGVSEALLLLDE